MAIPDSFSSASVKNHTIDAKPTKQTTLTGDQKQGWPSYLPKSWIPYVQLTRLNSLAPIFLVFFPHLFGALWGATVARASPLDLLRAILVLFGGSIFFSNSAHIWDDVIDAPLDALVERTCRRPIPRGAVSKSAAVTLMVMQAILALSFFYWFPLVDSWVYVVPSIVGSAYYPFAKRHTNIPQVVLGLCLSWGVFIGSLAMGVKPFLFASKIDIDWPVASIFAACVSWTIMYDTLYARLDLKDDVRLSIGSTAVLTNGYTKAFLWTILTGMGLMVVAAGLSGQLGYYYYCIAAGGSMVSLSAMIANVDLDDSSSICWWFSTGFLYPAGFITAGLLVEYVARMEIM